MLLSNEVTAEQAKEAEKLQFNLQHFAEGGSVTPDPTNPATGGAPSGGVGGTEDPAPTEPNDPDADIDWKKKYHADVTNIKKNAYDEAIKQARIDAQKELDDAKQQAQRKKDLSKLSEEERNKIELAEAKQEIAKLKAQADRAEAQRQLEQQLAEKSIDKAFAPFILKDTAEETLQALNDFEDLFTKAVQANVDDRFNQGAGAPKGLTPPQKDGDYDLVAESEKLVLASLKK